jgi:hypothetical protein
VLFTVAADLLQDLIGIIVVGAWDAFRVAYLFPLEPSKEKEN